MKEEFVRKDDLFSLCGLNCGLCPMKSRGGCGGCFSDGPCYTNCPIAPCSVKHGGVQYCYECSEYPCKRYDGIDKYDSLISHRNQKKDLAKAKEIGIEAYLDEQRAKVKILNHLMKNYDEDEDVFFCLAANMLPLDALTAAVTASDEATSGMDIEDKTAHVKKRLYAAADELGIELKLRRWRSIC